MQKAVIIALALIGTLTAGFLLLKSHNKQDTTPLSDLQEIYNQWKVDHNINIGSAENDLRFNIFSSNYKTITQHNSNPDNTFTMGLNAFAHLSREEFVALHVSGLKSSDKTRAKNFADLPTAAVPKKVDWRSKMNPIKNEGQCGSTWAFSAVEAIEGLYHIKQNKKLDLSEQEVMDCSGAFGNFGCEGGLMDSAFQYIISVGGIASTKEYPYTGTDGQCKNVTTRYGMISGFVDVKNNSTQDLIAAIAQQPVSVAVEADQQVFQFYTSGVVNGTSCGTQLDHALVAVGYNTEAKMPYYIVRNQWGDTWGDKGHVMIAIEEGPGVCGIQLESSYPTI